MQAVDVARAVVRQVGGRKTAVLGALFMDIAAHPGTLSCVPSLHDIVREQLPVQRADNYAPADCSLARHTLAADGARVAVAAGALLALALVESGFPGVSLCVDVPRTHTTGDALVEIVEALAFLDVVDIADNGTLSADELFARTQAPSPFSVQFRDVGCRVARERMLMRAQDQYYRRIDQQAQSDLMRQLMPLTQAHATHTVAPNVDCSLLATVTVAGGALVHVRHTTGRAVVPCDAGMLTFQLVGDATYGVAGHDCGVLFDDSDSDADDADDADDDDDMMARTAQPRASVVRPVHTEWTLQFHPLADAFDQDGSARLNGWVQALITCAQRVTVWLAHFQQNGL